MMRQGDLLFIRRQLATIRLGTPAEKDGDTVILARGEVTGHAHRVAAEAVRASREETNRIFLEITKDVEVTHEEHDPVKLTPGVWEVRRQREESGPLESPDFAPRFLAD